MKSFACPQLVAGIRPVAGGPAMDSLDYLLIRTKSRFGWHAGLCTTYPVDDVYRRAWTGRNQLISREWIIMHQLMRAARSAFRR